MKTALTIAGSDSSGGAGVQADLKTFAAHGVYGTSAITAVTAQSTVGVTEVYPLAADIVTAQIEAVSAAIEELELPLVVLDPVMIAKGGAVLLSDEALDVLRTELLRQASVV